MSLDAFMRKRRTAMVKYAAGLMTPRLGAERAELLAEDVVQAACLRYLERQLTGQEQEWSEGRFVGMVRYLALDAGTADAQTFEVRNTAEDNRHHRALGQRKARTTSTFPVQIFGRTLTSSFDGDDPENTVKRAA